VLTVALQPVAAYGRSIAGRVALEGLVASPDGSRVVRVAGDGEPEEVGERLAREALAAGAEQILRDIRG
jgi:hydroxymethylbilane synthase